jgi:Phosphotransferase enzyme family
VTVRVEDRALRAARAVAGEHDLPCEDAVVLPGGSNVLVHLRPSAAVARVMTATAVLHDDRESWLAREVAVGRFLAARGLAVSPTRLLPPGPHRRDGLWLTIWDYAPYERPAGLPRATELGHSLRNLHAALRDFDGELDPLLRTREGIARLLDALPPASEIDSLRAKLDELTPLVFDSSQPVQALHGDAGIGNLLHTGEGLLWNDLEDVCSGPVAWDVAGVVVSARARGADGVYVEELLDAYGGPGLEELSDFIAADELYMAVWRSYEAQRGG